MVLEDYGELMFLQTVLKKIGFDVDAIQNTRGFNDHVLAMNPDLVVLTALGKKVNGLELSHAMKRVRGLPRTILIRQPGAPHEDDLTVDKWLQSPVGAVDLLHAIADVCGLNKDVLSEKFQRLRLQDTDDESRVLHLKDGEKGGEMKASVNPSAHFVPVGEPGDAPAPAPSAAPDVRVAASTLSQSERDDRYKKFLAEERPAHVGFGVKQVHETVKSLRKEENENDLADLERERKLFVEHLFNKKKA